MPIEFNGSERYTLGVEEELLIVDASTGELVPKIEDIMSRLPEDLSEFVSYELFQSVLEIKTSTCDRVADAEKQLRELRGRVNSWAAASDASLAAAGTHPFSRYKDQKVTEQDRYRTVMDTLRWIAEREVIFGQHVHVGVPGPEEAIHAHNRLSEHASLLLALSANSPFWQGFDTGFESARVKIFENFPRGGLPPAFPDYDAFEGYVDLMVEAEAMDDYTYCWWDVRPHPEIGTIELRILDTQIGLGPATALTALTQCIVAHALEDRNNVPQGPYHREMAQENKLRAARHGMNAVFYDAANKVTIPAADAVQSLIEKLRPHAQDLGCENELQGVLDIVEGGTGSRRQREVYEKSGDFLEVVAFLIEGMRPALAEEQS